MALDTPDGSGPDESQDTGPLPPYRDGSSTGQLVRRSGWVWEWNAQSGRTGWRKVRRVTDADHNRIPPSEVGLDEGFNLAEWRSRRAGGVDAPDSSPGRDGGGSGGGSGGGDGGADSDLTPEQVRTKVLELFPLLSWAIKHPELGPILERAAEKGWTAARLEGRIMRTRWWKTHADTQRRWVHLMETDPATAKLYLRNKMFDVQALAISRLGFTMTGDQRKKVATLAMMTGWTDDQIIDYMRELKGFSEKSDAEVDFFDKQKNKPAQLHDEINERAADLIALARQLGIPLGNNRQVFKLATNAVKHGWTEEQTRQALLGEINFNKLGEKGGVKPSGELASTLAELKRLSAQYMIPIGEGALQTWMRNIMVGTWSIERFEQYMKEQAISRFPHLKGQINEGLTVSQLSQPIKQMIADELELKEGDVDLLKGKYAKYLEPVTVDGKVAPWTLSEVQRDLRSTTEWWQTDRAHEQTAGVMEKLGETFGMIA